MQPCSAWDAWATDGGNSLAALEIEGGFKETFNHGVIAVILAPIILLIAFQAFCSESRYCQSKNMNF